MQSKNLLLIPMLLLVAQNAAAVAVGTIAIYSDGSAMKRLASEGGKSIWEDDRKRRYTVSKNPVMPVLERMEFLGDRGYRQRLVSGQPDAVLSKPVGTKVDFSIIKTRQTGNSSRRNYQCVRLQSAKQEVLGKQRHVDRYRCERYVVHRKYLTTKVVEKRDISYSPELDLVVDLKRQKPNKTSARFYYSTSVKSLVALIPPGKSNLPQMNSVLRKIRKRK